MDGWIESRRWEFGARVVFLCMRYGMVGASGARRFIGVLYRDRFSLGLAEVQRRIVGIIAIYPGPCYY